MAAVIATLAHDCICSSRPNPGPTTKTCKREITSSTEERMSFMELFRCYYNYINLYIYAFILTNSDQELYEQLNLNWSKYK